MNLAEYLICSNDSHMYVIQINVLCKYLPYAFDTVGRRVVCVHEVSAHTSRISALLITLNMILHKGNRVWLAISKI